MLRDRSFGDTSNAATVTVTKRDVSLLMEKMKNIFSNYSRHSYGGGIDVSPHGLSRNVKYCSTMVHFTVAQ
jgi:hypothetical protein